MVFAMPGLCLVISAFSFNKFFNFWKGNLYIALTEEEQINMSTRKTLTSRKGASSHIDQEEDTNDSLTSAPYKELLEEVERAGKKLKDHGSSGSSDFKKALTRIGNYIDVLLGQNNNLEQQLRGMEVLKEKNAKLEEKLNLMDESMKKQEKNMKEREGLLQQQIKETVEEESSKQRKQLEELLKTSASSQPINIQETIKEALETQLQKLISEQIKNEITTAIAEIFGEKEEVRQIITNTIKDALPPLTTQAADKPCQPSCNLTYAQSLSQKKTKNPTLVLSPLDRTIPTTEIKKTT